MKKFLALFLISLLIGSTYAADTNGAVNSPTTGSMNASKPTPGAAPGVDANGKTEPNENSSGFTENVRVYWNKFIDVFTGPSSHR